MMTGRVINGNCAVGVMVCTPAPGIANTIVWGAPAEALLSAFSAMIAARKDAPLSLVLLTVYVVAYVRLALSAPIKARSRAQRHLAIKCFMPVSILGFGLHRYLQRVSLLAIGLTEIVVSTVVSQKYSDKSAGARTSKDRTSAAVKTLYAP